MSDTHTWSDLAVELYDKLTGRGAEITYNFTNLEVWVPLNTSTDATKGHWKLNGTVSISTRDTRATK